MLVLEHNKTLITEIFLFPNELAELMKSRYYKNSFNTCILMKLNPGKGEAQW